MFDLEYQLKHLPDKPGVYMMKNASGEIIYVGKAKILKNRVRQYFQSSKNHPEKVKAMVSNIAEFEYIVTDSEMEALILECNLIKKHRPKYNILLKDDKHYPFIKVTMNEQFPRVFVTRNIAKDGSRYFGPYTDASAVYETIELVKKLFPVRTCKKNVVEEKQDSRPCLNYHIGLCKAPCSGCITRNQYGCMIQKIIDLLSGKDKEVMDELRSQMDAAARELQFEKAASFRDKIIAVQKITEKQKIITGNFENEDYINIYCDEKDACVQVFFYRDGKLTGREHFILENVCALETSEILSEFLTEFYGGTAFIPKSIYVPAMEDLDLLEEWLTLKKGSKAYIKLPQKGEKKDTLNLVAENARMTLENFKTKIMQDKEMNKISLEELADALGLESLPERIEAYDISNIQGMDSVGSMVVFENGTPKNSDYRRFKINGVSGPNDYESMREVLTRRFQHGIDEVKAIQQRNISLSSGKFCVFPDLIMMDGGKGQVNIALEVLNHFGVDVPVCGLVKDDRHNTRGMIFNDMEIEVRASSHLMKFITRVQDEVHRFAITYHRSLRDKRILHSVLDDIPNIGQKRRKELLKKFGSIESIKNASYEELVDTPSIDSRAAESIMNFFKNNVKKK